MMTVWDHETDSLISGRDGLLAGQVQGIGRGVLGNKMSCIDPEAALTGAWSAPSIMGHPGILLHVLQYVTDERKIRWSTSQMTPFRPERLCMHRNS